MNKLGVGPIVISQPQESAGWQEGPKKLLSRVGQALFHLVPLRPWLISRIRLSVSEKRVPRNHSTFISRLISRRSLYCLGSSHSKQCSCAHIPRLDVGVRAVPAWGPTLRALCTPAPSTHTRAAQRVPEAGTWFSPRTDEIPPLSGSGWGLR